MIEVKVFNYSSIRTLAKDSTRLFQVSSSAKFALYPCLLTKLVFSLSLYCNYS